MNTLFLYKMHGTYHTLICYNINQIIAFMVWQGRNKWLEESDLIDI